MFSFDGCQSEPGRAGLLGPRLITTIRADAQKKRAHSICYEPLSWHSGMATVEASAARDADLFPGELALPDEVALEHARSSAGAPFPDVGCSPDEVRFLDEVRFRSEGSAVAADSRAEARSGDGAGSPCAVRSPV